MSIGCYRGHGNYIAASAAYLAFNWDTQVYNTSIAKHETDFPNPFFSPQGSSLAVLPLDTKGRQARNKIPIIHAHTDFISDFAFSPFDDGLLATGSQDLAVRFVTSRGTKIDVNCSFF